MRYLKIFYLNLSAYTLFFVFSGVGIPVFAAFVGLFRIFGSRRTTMKRLRRTINFYGRVVARLPFPLVRVHYEDLSEKDNQGPYIFVCNHRGTVDAFLIGYLPVELVQVVNVWPFSLPVLGICARAAGYLDINTIGSEAFFKRASGLLAQGVSIVFFPEGTRSASREMGNFHSAAFRLSLETKVPIVPVCMSGTENILKKGSSWLNPGTISICKLPAIQYEKFKDLNAYRLKNMVRKTIADKLSLMEDAA